MTLLIVLICITIYIFGWIYAFKCYSKDTDSDFSFAAAFLGLFFIPIILYYVEYYRPSPKKPKPIKDDQDLLNAILSHGDINDKGIFVVGGEKISIYDTYISIGNAMNIDFSKEALDKIRKQYLLLKITK